MKTYKYGDRFRLGNREMTISVPDGSFNATPHVGFTWYDHSPGAPVKSGAGWMPTTIFEQVATPGWFNPNNREKWSVQVGGGRGDATYQSEFVVYAEGILDATLQALDRLKLDDGNPLYIESITQE